VALSEEEEEEEEEDEELTSTYFLRGGRGGGTNIKVRPEPCLDLAQHSPEKNLCQGSMEKTSG
jgi:hypothetical protein